MLKINKVGLICLLLFSQICTFAQNNTNSPYTRYGLGLLADRSFGAGRAMGGIGYGLRSSKQINPMNPASYSSLDSLTFMFDFGASGQVFWYNDGINKQKSMNGNIEYLAMQFPIMKGLAMSVGLLPYSFVGYDFGSGELSDNEKYQAFETAALPLTYTLAYIFPLMYLYWKGLRRLNSPLGEQLPEYDSIRLDRPRFGRMGLWAFIPVVILLELAVIILISSLPEGMEMPEWFSSALEQMYGTNIVFNLLTMSVLAPLLEEFLFRGVILTGLMRRMDTWWAILWSSVLFGIAHLNPWQALPAFVMGCLFGWIYVRTRSYWTVVAMHSLNNTLTIMVAAFFGPEVVSDETMQSMFGPQVTYIMLAVSALVLAAGIGLINKYISSDEKSDISH